jgi:hypothetical protein
MSPFNDVVVLGKVSEMTMGGHCGGTDPNNGVTTPNTQSGIV